MAAGQARQGLLLSVGAGGASQFASAPGLGQAGASDLDLRVGYGFSDRFQLFADLDFQQAAYGDGVGSSNRTLMLRGQTVLVGDRRGNGLSLNGGVGMGSFTSDLDPGFDPAYGRYRFDGPYGGHHLYENRMGFAAGGGLSFDARVGRFLTISPELFASWHVVPNADRKNDIATELGLRLNLLWYLK